MGYLGKKIEADMIDITKDVDILIDNNYIYSESPITGPTYSDITSIENWSLYGKYVTVDYLQIRDQIKEQIGIINWSGCNNVERGIIIDYYVVDETITPSENTTNKITYLMSIKGLSQDESIRYLQDVFGSHHIKDLKSCAKRAESPKLYSVVAKYLDLNDARDFFQTVRNLYIDFKEQAIKGTLDGDVGVGLFDYIECTPGTIYEYAGLSSKGYVMQNGDTDTINFSSELMDIFRGGKI